MSWSTGFASAVLLYLLTLNVSYGQIVNPTNAVIISPNPARIGETVVITSNPQDVFVNYVYPFFPCWAAFNSIEGKWRGPLDPDGSRGVYPSASNSIVIQSVQLTNAGQYGYYESFKPGCLGYGATVLVYNYLSILYPIDLSPVMLKWHTNGGVLFTYQVTENALPTSTTAKLYWAKGTNVADVLPGTPIYSTNISSGFIGISPTNAVSSQLLQNPPANATHMLLRLDPDNRINEINETNNVITLQIPDLLASSLQWSMTSEGGLDFAYSEQGPPLPTNTTATLFWANGVTISNILPSGLIFTTNILAGFTGQSPVIHVSSNLLSSPPPGATHVLLVIDVDNFIVETNELNNVLAICDCRPKPLFPRPPRGSVTTFVGWKFKYEVTDNDGLVLTDVQLGSRYMAKKMSLPYYNLKVTNDLGIAIVSDRFQLKPDSDEAVCRSRLIGFSPPSQSNPEIQAVYQIDRIGTSCMVVTQHYRFTSVDVLPEPSQTFVARKFYPIVKYQFCGQPGETLEFFSTAQRLHFEIDGIKTNKSEIIRDTGLPPPALTQRYRDDPLDVESTIDAILRGNKGTWDNFHTTWADRIDEPASFNSLGVFAQAGCPECVHIHWRWQVPPIITSQDEPFSGKPLIPRRDGVPPYDYDSDQSVKVAVVRFEPNEEDPQDASSLVLDPEFPQSQLSGETALVFWYLATGYRHSDEFFTHGGFFSATPPILMDIKSIHGIPYELLVKAPPCTLITPEIATEIGHWGGLTEPFKTTGPITPISIGPFEGPSFLSPVVPVSGPLFFRVRAQLP